MLNLDRKDRVSYINSKREMKILLWLRFQKKEKKREKKNVRRIDDRLEGREIAISKILRAEMFHRSAKRSVSEFDRCLGSTFRSK